MKKWFVQVESKIHGPLNVTEVDHLIVKNKDGLIWGKGMSEWISYAEWKASLEVTIEKESRAMLWQYRFNENESKLYKLDELIHELKRLPGYDNVFVKSDQDPKWQLLYTAVTVTERLGVTRRGQLRVPIFGFFEGHNLTLDESINSKLITISEGGFGLTDAFGLKIGHSIKGQIVSPNLSQPLAILGDVVYSGEHGELGIKFSSISEEAHSLIIEYISKFKDIEK